MTCITCVMFGALPNLMLFQAYNTTVVHNQWNGLLDWNTGMDYHIFGFYIFLGSYYSMDWTIGLEY